MNRKSILASGIILSIIYALSIVSSICLFIAAIVYFFVADSTQIIYDLFNPILQPFLGNGNVMMLVFIALLIFLSIFLFILATKLNKYARLNKETFQTKKGLSLFYLVCFILATGALAFVLIENLLNGFSVIDAVVIVLIALHVVSCGLLIYGLGKEQVVTYAKEEEQPKTIVNPSRPPIYTFGLDEQKQEEQKHADAKTPSQPKAKLKESESSMKLVESVGKLDQMRKEGSISTEEYTKLRSELIKKFIK